MKKRKDSKQQSKHEVRVAPHKFEIRKNADGTRSVEGFFATWGQMSHDIGFREVLQKGCFAQSLRDNPVSCFRDHNAEMLLGKTQSSTLLVEESDKGLKYLVKLPDTSYANDLVALMERGDATECSFAFSTLPDGETWSQLPNGEILRTVTNAILYEGSILTGAPAAYPNTEASLRNAPKAIRAKLRGTGKREFDDDDEQDDVCNPDSPDYDPDACDDEEDDEDREVCQACGQPIPDEADEEERQAHFELISRKLRS